MLWQCDYVSHVPPTELFHKSDIKMVSMFLKRILLGVLKIWSLFSRGHTNNQLASYKEYKLQDYKLSTYKLRRTYKAVNLQTYNIRKTYRITCSVSISSAAWWPLKGPEDIYIELFEAHRKLQSSGRRRHYAEEAVIRLSGPLLPIIVGDDVRKSSHHALGFGHNYH